MEIHAVDHIARAFEREGRNSEGINAYKEQLDLSRGKSDWHGQARTHRLLSHLMHRLGDVEGAIHHAQSAVDVFESGNDRSCAEGVRKDLRSGHDENNRATTAADSV
jgi:hypothetical protein